MFTLHSCSCCLVWLSTGTATVLAVSHNAPRSVPASVSHDVYGSCYCCLFGFARHRTVTVLNVLTMYLKRARAELHEHVVISDDLAGSIRQLFRFSCFARTLPSRLPMG